MLTNPILSVCVPTTPDRREQCEALVGEFLRQAMQYTPSVEFRGFVRNVPGGVVGGWVSPDIELHYYEDDRLISVGAKRDALYRMSNGIYALQWDSDDGIHPDAVSKIMYALSSIPDCVTYQERCDMDGVIKKSNHSTSYRDWEGDGSNVLADGFHFHRTPFFKDVIRRDYCVHIGVADMRYGEDHDFSLLIKPMLLNEVHIDEELYLYNYTPAEHNAKYGIK